MITLKEDALKELERYFDGKPKETIRIYLASGGCQGPRLALALDDANDEDDTFEASGFPFCMNKELHTTVGGVTIDISYMGFVIDPEIPLPKSASSCSGSCSGCAGH